LGKTPKHFEEVRPFEQQSVTTKTKIGKRTVVERMFRLPDGDACPP
jgi:hypothetical protein